MGSDEVMDFRLFPLGYSYVSGVVKAGVNDGKCVSYGAHGVVRCFF